MNKLIKICKDEYKHTNQKNAHARMQDYAMSNGHDKRAQDQLKEN